MRDLWVDFNDLDARGHTTTLAKFARVGVSLAIGARVVVGDDDGNLCGALITGVGVDGQIALAVDLGTFQASDCVDEALV